MVDRPILFSAPMVRALLEGRKTQTRRVIAERNLRIGCASEELEGLELDGWEGFEHEGEMCAARVPYRVGDRLWVRESWCAQEVFDDMSPIEIGERFEDEHGEPWCPTFYEADKRCCGASVEIWQQSPIGRLRPGIHMPRWCSRLTLGVTDVRVQRLQALSEEDARAEGVEPQLYDGPEDWEECPQLLSAPGFQSLWDSLNEGRAAWASNPWVIALTFTVHPQNIDTLPQASGQEPSNAR